MKKIYILSLFSLVVFTASCEKIDEFLGTGGDDMANDTIPIAQDVSAELSMQDVDDLIAIAPAVGGDPVNADDIVDLDGDPTTPNSEFVTEIAVVGDIVEFAINVPGDDTVRIDEIRYKDDGSFNLFESVGGSTIVLTPETGSVIRDNFFSDPRFPEGEGGFGIVAIADSVAVMVALPDSSEETMNYSIIFTIIRDGVEYGPYIVDPKMQARMSR